jgi:carbon storage regulator
MKPGNAKGSADAKSQFTNEALRKSKELEMLVLSRKVNERIVIDGGIVITVVKIEGGQVRIGIDAPNHVKVFREEILGKSARPQSDEACVAAGI